MKLLFINGVNLNMTGMREKGVYGTETLDVINAEIAAHFKNDTCKFYQSNFEGDICTELQKAPKDGFDGVILNAGAFTHWSRCICQTCTPVRSSGTSPFCRRSARA